MLDIFNLSKMSGPNAKKAKVATEFDPREDASSPSSIEEEYFSAEEEPAAGPSTLLQSIEPAPDGGPSPSPVSDAGSESQALAGGRDKKCPFCDRGPYQDTRSLKRHMSRKHKDEADYQEKYKSVPRSPGKLCRTGCGKILKNLYQKHACKGEKQINPQEGDIGFLQAFKAWLESPLGNNCKPNTCDLYTLQVRKFIIFEKRNDAGFCPWNWLRWGQPGCVLIRDCSEFLVASDSNDTQMLMSTAYSKLTTWIEQKISEAEDTPRDQFKRRVNNNAMVHRQLKRGKTFRKVAAAAEGERAEEQDARHRWHLDPAITQRLMIAWQASYSQLRKEGALKAIAKGDFNIPTLEIRTEEGALSFLSLTFYLKNFGIRSDVLRNMTLGELKKARQPPVQCTYCKNTVPDYQEHKIYCPAREVWTFGQGPDQGGYTRETLGVDYRDYDSGSETGEPLTWAIHVSNQKTQNTVKSVLVIVDDLEFLALRALIPHGMSKAKGYRPFGSIEWDRHMRPILKRMVGHAGEVDLWKDANPPGKPLGSFEFKRLFAKQRGDKGGPDGDRLATAVGTSKNMLENTYDPRMEVERARAEQLRQAEAERKMARRVGAEHRRQVEFGRAKAEQLRQRNPSTQHQGRGNSDLMEDQGRSSLGANVESTFESNKPLQEPNSDSDTEDNLQALMVAARKLQFNPTNNTK